MLIQIPTTRAISPKLGRTKNSNSEVNNSSEGTVTSSPRVSNNQNNPKKGSEKDVVDSKKPVVRKSQPKLHSQEKTEAKPIKSKAKSAGKERHNQKEERSRETEQSQDQDAQVSEPNNNMNQDAQTNAPELIPQGHEIMPQEVAVGV